MVVKWLLKYSLLIVKGALVILAREDANLDIIQKCFFFFFKIDFVFLHGLSSLITDRYGYGHIFKNVIYQKVWD